MREKVFTAPCKLNLNLAPPTEHHYYVLLLPTFKNNNVTNKKAIASPADRLRIYKTSKILRKEYFCVRRESEGSPGCKTCSTTDAATMAADAALKVRAEADQELMCCGYTDY